MKGCLCGIDRVICGNAFNPDKIEMNLMAKLLYKKGTEKGFITVWAFGGQSITGNYREVRLLQIPKIIQIINNLNP